MFSNRRHREGKSSTNLLGRFGTCHKTEEEKAEREKVLNNYIQTNKMDVRRSKLIYT
jgi:hypothetical protein